MDRINNYLDKIVFKIQPSRNVCNRLLKYTYCLITIGLIVDVSVSMRYEIKMISLSVLLLIILFLSYDKDSFNRITKYKRSLIILFVLLGVCFFINGFILKSGGYILYSIIYILIIPGFIFFKINWSDNIKAFIYGIYIANWCIVIVSFLIAPINRTPGGYTSIVGNQNYLSALISIFFIGLLVCNHIKNSNLCKSLIGIDLLFLVLSQSRTGILVCSISFLIYFSFLCRMQQMNKKTSLLTIVILTMAIVSSFTVFSFVTPNTYEYAEKHFEGLIQNVEYVNDYDIKFTDSFFEKMGKGVVNSRGRFTSGRREIWEEYVKHIEFKGHKVETISVYDNGKIQERDAHNSIIQISYSGGILCGMFLSLIFLLCLINSGKYLVGNRKRNIYNIFSIMIVIAYIVTSMFSSIYVPMSGLMALAFYIFVGSLEYE